MPRTRSLVPLTELALALVSLAAVLSFNRLFDDGSFFGRLAVFALASHGVAVLGRRLRWGLGATGAASLLGLAVVTALVLYPSTTLAGIPTGDTWSMVRGDLSHAVDQFQAVQAPAPVTTAFLLAAGWALWWAAFVADWAAFRLWVPFESVVPAGTVFVFASLFAAKSGPGDHRVLAATAFLVAALLFLLVHRVARQQASAAWMTSETDRGTGSLLRLGGALAAAAVIVAVVVGPSLPQARAKGLYDWRQGDQGDKGRTVVSPFVDIQKKLLQQTQEEVFQVQSDQRAYWRLTSLDQFDGQVWSSNGSYKAASGELPSELDGAVPTATATQTFTVEALGSIWVPAAFEPRRLDSGGTPVRYEASSGTLIVTNDRPSSDGLVYTVQSVLPVFDPAQLAAAPAEVPGDIARDDLQLPPSLSERVRALALEVTGSQPTQYGKARALQDWFRSQFTYSLDVPPGQSVDAIESFLDSRQGYCEQFAGTYAAMARAVGLPARVAVGYTMGDADPTTPGLYHVRGEHAHAWPEVYLAGQGWVLFEPTPGRGAPRAEQYTGVQEQQSAGGVGTGSTVSTVTSTTVATTATVPGSTVPSAGATPACPRGEDCTSTTRSSRSWLRTWLPRIGIALGALVLLAGLYVGGMLLWRHERARRRRAGAQAEDEQVRVAWEESVEALALVGLQPARSETPLEFASRAEGALERGLCRPIAEVLEEADYSPTGVADGAGEGALAQAELVAQAVRERTTGSQRLKWALDPRPVARRGPRGRTPDGRLRARRDAPAIEVLSLRG